MKQFASVFASVFARPAVDPTSAAREQIRRDWSKQRERALTPADRAEIDAMFSRYL